MVKILALIAGVLLLGYLLALAWMYMTQAGRVYKPRRDIGSAPDAYGYAYEEVTLHSADGITLWAWFVPNPRAHRVLLFCHGNTRNISQCMDSVELFQRLGFSVFLFDYRGYGRSAGRPDEHGTYLDVQAAWEYLLREREYAPDDIVVLGRSLGGAIASWLAARHTPRALVLESTFTSLSAVAAYRHPWFPARALIRYRYPVAEYVRALRCPLLIVHSRDDEMVPFRYAERLFALASEPKELLMIEGMHHNGYQTTGARYEEGLASFLARHA
ncbi:MAG: alpha/beta hydrolase [Chromatiales bacterium]|jgi:fermentation-respiration switch protein FrsA (DUF1100 family)|nr:alpha/beta hydrolase [Chromatiales bacterium]